MMKKQLQFTYNLDILGGRRVIEAKHYRNGSIYLLDMTNNAWSVVQTNCEDDDLVSRKMFVFGDTTKEDVWKRCKSYFQNLKESLIKEK